MHTLPHFLNSYIQSNVNKMTTLWTTQKCSSWPGGHLIKHFYKMANKQMWPFLAGFQYPNGSICLNRDFLLHVLEPFLKIKNALGYFLFLTYIH